MRAWKAELTELLASSLARWAVSVSTPASASQPWSLAAPSESLAVSESVWLEMPLSTITVTAIPAATMSTSTIAVAAPRGIPRRWKNAHHG